jgi:histidine triad (HIT) family protein
MKLPFSHNVWARHEEPNVTYSNPPHTIFQQIIRREIPADIVFEDDQCLAFRDIRPAAPVHVLVIPKKPVRSIDELTEEDQPLIGHLWMVIRQLVDTQGLHSGYRVVVNCGSDGGQTVEHLHFHLLGGRAMSWPPG